MCDTNIIGLQVFYEYIAKFRLKSISGYFGGESLSGHWL